MCLRLCFCLSLLLDAFHAVLHCYASLFFQHCLAFACVLLRFPFPCCFAMFLFPLFLASIGKPPDQSELTARARAAPCRQHPAACEELVGRGPRDGAQAEERSAAPSVRSSRSCGLFFLCVCWLRERERDRDRRMCLLFVVGAFYWCWLCVFFPVPSRGSRLAWRKAKGTGREKRKFDIDLNIARPCSGILDS